MKVAQARAPRSMMGTKKYPLRHRKSDYFSLLVDPSVDRRGRFL